MVQVGQDCSCWFKLAGKKYIPVVVTFTYCLSLLYLPGFTLNFSNISDMYQIDIGTYTIYKLHISM